MQWVISKWTETASRLLMFVSVHRLHSFAALLEDEFPAAGQLQRGSGIASRRVALWRTLLVMTHVSFLLM